VRGSSGEGEGVLVAETVGANPEENRNRTKAEMPAETASVLSEASETSSPDAPTSAASDEDAPTENRPATKPCPYCNEIIRADAVTCRFCGHDLVAAHPTKLVLSNDTWNTDVPQWLLDVEQKALRRRQFIRKLQQLQWPVVVTIISLAVGAIIFRVLFPPTAPEDKVRVLPRYPKATASPSPVAAGRPSATPSPSTSSLGGFSTTETGATTSPTPGASPLATPTPEATSTPMFSSAPPPSDASPAIVTTAKDIAEEFQSARAIADDKFNGQSIRVTGDVRSIDTTSPSPFVILTTGAKLPPVKCILKLSEKANLARLKPGRLAQLRGTCEGAFLEVILSDCVIEF
jgi:hypothetical protein